MILDFVMVADAATVSEGKLYVQGGAVTRFNVPELPFVLPPIATIVRFVLEEGDFGRERIIEFDWLLDASPIVPPVLGPIAPQKSPIAVEGEEHSAVVVVTFNGLRFTQAGIHALAVKLDDQLLARRTFPVVLMAEAPGGGKELGRG